MKISKCWNNAANRILKFCMPGVNTGCFDLLQRAEKPKGTKAVRNESTWPEQTWGFSCQYLPGDQGEWTSSIWFKERLFCKILVLCFATDLAGGSVTTDTERTGQGWASVRSLVKIIANPRVVPTLKVCDLARTDHGTPSLHPLSAARRNMARTWEMGGMFCTGHREMHKKTYFVNLQLISIVGTCATKWQWFAWMSW